MTVPRENRRLPVVVAGVAVTSAAALLIGVGAASLFAGETRDMVIALMTATAVAGVVGGFVGVPLLFRTRR